MKDSRTQATRADLPWYRSLRPGDALIALVIILTALGLLALNSRVKNEPSDFVVLVSEGQVIRRWTAEQLEKPGEEEVEARGYHYLLEWGEGRIRFAGADCPDKVCVRTGWIGRGGSIAACIPGGLVLKAERAGEPVGTDDSDVVIR